MLQLDLKRAVRKQIPSDLNELEQLWAKITPQQSERVILHNYLKSLPLKVVLQATLSWGVFSFFCFVF